MALPSVFRRKQAPKPPSDDAGVEDVRRGARRRLIGAVVLLGIGVIAFPLLFETAPRPIPVDLPIEIPRKDELPPLAMPGAAPPAVAASGQVTGAAPVEPAAVAQPLPPVAAPPAMTAKTAVPAPAPDAGRKRAAEPSPTPVAAAKTDKPAVPASNDRAQPAERWVVQVGAFAEERAVREVRAKVEKLGMSTYTQVVTVDSAKRTRVRVGPFDGRDEADAVAAKIKKVGLPVSVLRL